MKNIAIKERTSNSYESIEEMPTINRTAVVIKPQTPFLEWLASLEEQPEVLEMDNFANDCTCFLLPEVDHNSKAVAIIEEMYQEIFEKELGSYTRDESLWPQDRNWHTFQEWFKVETHSIVFDTLNSDINKESI